MPRIPLSLQVNDVSALARNLRRQMEVREQIPSHVEILNLLAKAGGYKNFQHLKAEQTSAVEPQPLEINRKRVRKTAGYFDSEGRLTRWPKKYSQRLLCIWALWAKIPARLTMTELEINERLVQSHLFGDHAMLRRWLVDEGLVSRTPDGRAYTRIETQPPQDALELFRLLH